MENSPSSRSTTSQSTVQRNRVLYTTTLYLHLTSTGKEHAIDTIERLMR